MGLIDLAHRWLGGVLGLLLAVLGLSGALLAHKDAWVTAPHAGEAQVQTTEALAAAAERMMSDPDGRPTSVVFATRDFGLNRLNYGREAGGYATQDGEVVARWSSQWERPELWLFDLHHHLFAGEAGEVVAGAAGLCGMAFVITGVILWWPRRRAYELRLWPRSFRRTDILRHHRDLGVLLAPLLIVSLLTGAAMVFRPVAGLVLGPGFAAEAAAALGPPPHRKAVLSDDLDWAAMIRTARRRHPNAEVRILALPRGDSGLISLRLRQPREWLPNGRTTLWFEADTGRLAHERDALAMPWRVQAYNAVYPLHAGKAGGLAYRLAVTASGLALTVLGAFTSWTFWFRRKRRPATSSARGY